MAHKTSPQTDMFQSMTNYLEQEMRKIIEHEIETFKQEFEPKMKQIVSECQQDLDHAMNRYYEQRKEFAKKMEDNLSNQANNKMSELRHKLDREIGNIEKELFNDPQSLLQQIKVERQKLECQRKMMKQEQEQWDTKEHKIARYLGFGHMEQSIQEDIKMNDENDEDNFAGLDDDLLNQDNNKYIHYKHKESLNNEQQNKGTDWITINVDGRIFGTYRSTLTQVPGSVLALMFGLRSEMMHRDNKGVYYLDRNSQTFAHVMEVLRRRGVMPNDFELTAELQAELMELGLLRAFFADEVLDQEVLLGGSGTKKVHFQSYRSQSNQENYVKWDICGLQSSKTAASYFELDKKDKTQMNIKQSGWYRLVVRIVARINNACYATVMKNGSHKYYCRHAGYSTQYYKSFNFNEILQLNKRDKIQIYSSQPAYIETKSSYLCLESIPADVLPQVAVYNSTTRSSNYRVWNSTVKSSSNFTLNSYQIKVQKSGLYHISARIHTYHATVNRSCYMQINRNGGNSKTIYNNQACSSGSTVYLCHHFEDFVELHPSEFIVVYDSGYNGSSDARYESINIQPIVSSGLIGSWNSNSHSSNIRIWTHTNACNPMLFEMVENKQKIVIKLGGYYRIGCMITNSNSNDGHAAIYVNGTQYCLSRMGVNSGGYTHTISIQEIVKLKKEDKIHIYASNGYNSYQYNTLFIEKLMV